MVHGALMRDRLCHTTDFKALVRRPDARESLILTIITCQVTLGR